MNSRRRTAQPGEVYNGVEVLEYVGSTKGLRMYACRCHCGAVFITAGRRITSGHTTSCGCARAAARHGPLPVPLVPDEQYGNWRVLDRTPRLLSGRVPCECVCGASRAVSFSALRYKLTNSCGCRSSQVARDRARDSAKDLVGTRVGRWAVETLAETSVTPGKDKYTCRCDCGTVRELDRKTLQGGQSQSCGCLHREVSAALCEASATHGHARQGARSAAYVAWAAMWSRVRHDDRYAGRVSVCEAWRDFPTFLRDMGEPPGGLTLDRIDGSGGYSKDNCRWADWVTQGNNTSRNVRVEFRGERLTYAQVGRVLGIHPGTVRSRAIRGVPLGMPLRTAPQEELV